MKQIILIFILCSVITLCSFSLEGKSKVFISGNRIVRIEQNIIITVSELAISDEFPFGFGPTYSISPDSIRIAFIGYEKSDFEIYLFNIEKAELIAIGGTGDIDGRTKLVWAPNDSLLIFNRGERLWLYEVNSDSTRQLTDPKGYYEDYDPSFSDDGKKVFFYRGTRFEYSFSGDKYKINTNGIGLSKIEEESPKYSPEDYRGE